jgi:hypothetical protein
MPMLLPTIEGVIRRRVLVNFRVEAAVARRLLPAVFRPQLVNGAAMAGICLIRLEAIRPRGVPSFLGISSENAAHRFAVAWTNAQGGTSTGVYIPRRDSSSFVNRLVGGRLFPGEHHAATFRVDDSGSSIALDATADDGSMAIGLCGTPADALPTTSSFASMEQASAFFQAGACGYSETKQRQRLDGVELRTTTWSMQPLTVTRVSSSFFADEALFPPGSVAFDSALLMRNIQHEWHSAAPLVRDAPGS